MKMKREIDVEIHGTRCNGTYADNRINASCNEEEGILNINSYSDDGDHHVYIKMPKEDFIIFVNGLNELIK